MDCAREANQEGYACVTRLVLVLLQCANAEDDLLSIACCEAGLCIIAKHSFIRVAASHGGLQYTRFTH